MNELKPWYLSRTIWASLVTVAVAGGGLAGVALESGDEAALTETIIQLVTAVSGAVALFGRIVAKSRIG